MTKYRSLEALLLMLSKPLAAGTLAISGSWRNDEQALGLLKPDEPSLTAYVFTHGQAPDRYGVHLDYPASTAAGAASLSAEELSLKSLCELLVTHFELHEINN
jgi:hypothetical protein